MKELDNYLKEKASPELIPPTDFDLDKDQENKYFAAYALSKLVKTYRETPDAILFKTGNNVNGYYVGYDKVEKRAYYVVRYERKSYKGLTKAVTQTSIWRDDLSSLSNNITKYVFFRILLPENSVILSDTQQTQLGRRFWGRMLAIANTRNLYIGLIDFQTKTIYKPENETVRDFWKRTEPLAYGSGVKYQKFRYYISETDLEFN